MKKTLKNLLLIGTGLAVTAGAITGTVLAVQASNQVTNNVDQNKIPTLHESGLDTEEVVEDTKNDTSSVVPEASESTNTSTAPNINDSTTSKPSINTGSSNTTTNKPSNGNTNATTGNNNVTSKPTVTPEVSKATLSFKALAKTESSSNNVEKPTHTMPERITKNFTSGWIDSKVLVKRGWGVEQDTIRNEQRYQSEYYYNQRDFMPILDSMHSQYPNERTQNDVEFDNYNGYNKTAGSVWWQGGVTHTEYTPSELLTSSLTGVSSEKIHLMKIDFSNKHFQEMSEESKLSLINQYLVDAVNKNINFITIENASQTELEKIVIPQGGISKLTIKDFNGKLKSLKGINVPSTVKELEFYSTTANRIDPTILSNSTHVIYDHIDGWNAGTGERLSFSPFKVIDLSNRTDLTNDKLQTALNTVYGERQYERSFQGDFTNGYIYNLDISGTPIKSLNNVYIPSQSDGRFNIAHVQWSAGVNSHGSVTVQIGGSNGSYPNNDAQVNEWYDSSKWAEQATKLMLNSDGKMSIDKVMSEVEVLMKRYPNISVVDITDVHLNDGENQKDLADKLTEKWGFTKVHYLVSNK